MLWGIVFESSQPMESSGLNAACNLGPGCNGTCIYFYFISLAVPKGVYMTESWSGIFYKDME